jgi:hypothetical protein
MISFKYECSLCLGSLTSLTPSRAVARPSLNLWTLTLAFTNLAACTAAADPDDRVSAPLEPSAWGGSRYFLQASACCRPAAPSIPLGSSAKARGGSALPLCCPSDGPLLADPCHLAARERFQFSVPAKAGVYIPVVYIHYAHQICTRYCQA